MDANVNPESQSRKPKPQWSGFFIAAWLWIVGVTMFFVPTYIGVHGIIGYILTGIGWVSLIISFGGALTELGTIFNNEGFTFLGVSLVFFIPSGIIHFMQQEYATKSAWIIISKSSVVILFLVGSGLLMYGISFFLEPRSSKQTLQNEQNKPTNSKSIAEVLIPVIVAILSLATAILQFVYKLPGK